MPFNLLRESLFKKQALNRSAANRRGTTAFWQELDIEELNGRDEVGGERL